MPLEGNICVIAFYIDTSQHLKEQNINLQEANEVASEIRDKHIRSQIKSRILIFQRLSNKSEVEKAQLFKQHVEKIISNNKLKFVFKMSDNTRTQSNVLIVICQ